MPYHWPTEEIYRSSLDLEKLPFPPFSQTPPLLLALPGRKGLGRETRRPPGLGRGLPWSLSPRQLPPAAGRRAGRCPRSPHTSVPWDGLEILMLSFYFSHLGNVRGGHSRNNCAPRTQHTHRTLRRLPRGGPGGGRQGRHGVRPSNLRVMTRSCLPNTPLHTAGDRLAARTPRGTSPQRPQRRGP